MKEMDLGGETSVFRDVNELADDDNVKVDTSGEISCSDDGTLTKLDKIASQVGSEVAMDSSEISVGKSLVDLGKQDAFQSVDIEPDDELCNSFPVHISKGVNEIGGGCYRNCKDLNADELKASSEGTRNDVDDHNAHDIVSSQCGSIDCTMLRELQESRVHGVEKSIEVKTGDGCALSVGADSIKACSCSFCTKATHILLDLNYQDIKARVSAIRKVQKEATIFAEKIIRSKVTEKHGAESLTAVSKLESDLMFQWRSLFQHTAGILEEEGNQLEARLPPLIDSIKKCKTDLALINAPSLEKH